MVQQQSKELQNPTPEALDSESTSFVSSMVLYSTKDPLFLWGEALPFNFPGLGSHVSSIHALSSCSHTTFDGREDEGGWPLTHRWWPTELAQRLEKPKWLQPPLPECSAPSEKERTTQSLDVDSDWGPQTLHCYLHGEIDEVGAIGALLLQRKLMCTRSLVI